MSSRSRSAGVGLVICPSSSAFCPDFGASATDWARAIHEQFPGVEGLMWTSNRCDPDDASLSFRDRVGPADLGVVAFRDGRRDSSSLPTCPGPGSAVGVMIMI